jgi:sporulation protein YlmC with PRC-barrel domain
MRKIKLVFLIQISCVFLVDGCFFRGGHFKYKEFTVLFKHIDRVKEGDPVILDGIQIGRVADIKQEGSNQAVKIEILKEYADKITKSSEFFEVNSGAVNRIEVIVIDSKSEVLNPNTPLIGYPEYRYWIRRMEIYVRRVFKKMIDKIHNYQIMEEWEVFRNKLEKEIENLKAKNNNEKKERFLELRKEAEEFYKRVKETLPEVAEKIKEYLENLFKDVNPQ